MVQIVSSVATGILVLSSSTFAVPTSGSSVKSTSINANFDDLAQLPVAVAPIGVYDGLNYQALFVATQGVAGAVITGVRPSSPPNVASYGVYGNILAGSVPMITTSGTSTKSFDLKKFNFGCVVNTAESAAAVATPCTITAVGYDLSGKQVYTQSFNFNSGLLGILGVPMTTANLEKTWTGLSSVTFSTSNSLGVLTGTLIDNVQYTIWS